MGDEGRGPSRSPQYQPPRPNGTHLTDLQTLQPTLLLRMLFSIFSIANLEVCNVCNVCKNLGDPDPRPYRPRTFLRTRSVSSILQTNYQS